MTPRVSVIVPSHGRPDKLGRLLACLAAQDERDFEVLVALDGGGAGVDVPAGLALSCLDLPRVGIGAAKNQAMRRARGTILLFVNDDVEPVPTFVSEHLRAHAAGAALVLGASPFAPVAQPRVLDALIATSRMIFFYDGLEAGNRYDFRHAWNLNLSVRRDRLPGGDAFASELRPCMFEDLELAHRLIGSRREVLYHPAAEASHNHRYELSGYFIREVLMGVMAPELWAANPDCFRQIFAESLPELEQRARAGLELDARDASRVLPILIESASKPYTNETPDDLLSTWYAAHLPLKRRAFRVGLLGAVDGGLGRPWSERPSLARELALSDAVLAPLVARG